MRLLFGLSQCLGQRLLKGESPTGLRRELVGNDRDLHGVAWTQRRGICLFILPGRPPAHCAFARRVQGRGAETGT